MLDRLEALAREATPPTWYAARHGKRVTVDAGSTIVVTAAPHRDQQANAAYIAAANPAAVIKLIAVVRAAQELDRLMRLPLRCPEGTSLPARVRHAEYGDEKAQAWASLRQALADLEPTP